MGEIRSQRPVLLVVGISSQYEDGFEWSAQEMTKHWGAIQFESKRFKFSETSYYAKTMGNSLWKQFLAFEYLIDAAEIATIKITTNAMEQAFTAQESHSVPRPLNLDPGYLTEAKLVLATTKDRDHRIYLQQGIFAEVTLYFQKNAWQASRWTYPDYCRDDSKDFFIKCRNWLRQVYQHDNPT